MGYVHFTDEQKERAGMVDLKDFLERQGEKLIRSGREWRMASDHSVTIRGNRWYDHGSAGKGGTAIDFVMFYYGKTFPEAVSMLLGGEQGEPYRRSEREDEAPRRPFALPDANGDMRRVFAYLLKGRFLDYEVVSTFAKEKLVYESLELSKDGTRQYHNAIFVGYDPDGKARHAHKKGIYTTGVSYRGNIESSDPRYSFHWNGKSGEIFVFEAPIDLLSYICLHKSGWKEHSYVSLCGVGSQALFQMLADYPGIKKIRLCLDHDKEGMKAAERIRAKLTETGYQDVEMRLSRWKDWNEDIKAARGMAAVPAEETLTSREAVKDSVNSCQGTINEPSPCDFPKEGAAQHLPVARETAEPLSLSAGMP